MRPLTSWICAKLALPITRLASRRPASATRRPAASSASAVQRRGVGVLGLQVAGVVVAAEVVGEGDALPSQRSELRAAFGDQAVFVRAAG